MPSSSLTDRIAPSRVALWLEEIIRVPTNMKVCVALLLCMVVLCACVSAQTKSNTQAPEEVNPAIESVDASVHAEVDGQQHEPASGEYSRDRLTPLSSVQQSTVVWPAHADSSSTPGAFLTSSFRAGTEARGSSTPQAVTSTASAGTKNDSGQGQGWSHPLNAKPAHSFYGSATPPLSPRASVPTVPASDRTQGLSAPFGLGLAAFPGSTDSFQANRFSYHKGRAVKRHRQYPRKSGTKSSQAGLPSP